MDSSIQSRVLKELELAVDSVIRLDRRRSKQGNNKCKQLKQNKFFKQKSMAELQLEVKERMNRIYLQGEQNNQILQNSMENTQMIIQILLLKKEKKQNQSKRKHMQKVMNPTIQCNDLKNLQGDANSDIELPFQSLSDAFNQAGKQLKVVDGENIIVFTSEEDAVEQFQVQEIQIVQNELQKKNSNDIQLQQEEKKEAQVPQQQTQQQQKQQAINIDYEGEFLKISPHKLQGTQAYYCTLERRKFKYYSIKDKKKPLGILDFDAQEYEFWYKRNSNNDIIQFTFKPQECQKLFSFEVPKKMRQSIEDWIQLIEAYINYSTGKQRHLMALAFSYRFWRHERIHEDRVRAEAQTGDLLIFRSQGTMSGLQRSLTGSDFDHIVMFIRHQDKQLYLFETSNQYGVIKFSYNNFVRNRGYRNYQKILYRQLQNVQNETREMLLCCAEMQIGKGYSLSPMKIVRKSKRQNFFCSELIAYVYMMAGLISDTAKCYKYLPGAFSSSESNLTLQNNALLSPDYVIDFFNY